MKKSIRIKLFFQIIIIVFSFTCLLWLLNSLYLEKYYLKEKKNMLIDYGKEINSYNIKNYNQYLNELEIIENTSGSRITIFDENNKVLYSSDSRLRMRLPIAKQLTPPPLQEIPKIKNIIKRKLLTKHIGSDSFITTIKDPNLGQNFLIYALEMKNGNFLEIRIALESISDSVKIINNFLIYISLIIALLAGIWAYITSKQFTHPILSMNKVTNKMCNLDFSEKCIVESENEFGQLALSINTLSNQLDKSITELNQKNKQLIKDIEQERKIDKMRKEFISNVSHELKTPLALIKGYAEGLKVNITNNEEKKDFYCDVITDETEKMNHLVRDLLNLSYIESGFLKLNKTQFDVKEFIEDTVNKYYGLFEKNSINLSTDLEQNLIGFGDILKIEQVLINYLTNAINHVDNSKKIVISSQMFDKNIRISVFNSGTKIHIDDIENLWNSFFKCDKARTREYGGHGLGLSIVKAIQNAHNQLYGVENVENGVIFYFDIEKF